MWRGDSSPFGCEAVVKPAHALYLTHSENKFGAASLPNGDKSPRHKAHRLRVGSKTIRGISHG